MPALGPRQAAEVSGTVASQAISPSWVSAPGVARERVWDGDVNAQIPDGLEFFDYDTRIAAYAVVVDGDRLLLSWWNGEQVGEPQWSLPGGGVDLAESRAVVAAGLFLIGSGVGVWDVAMNVEGAAVERLGGKTLMQERFADGRWQADSSGAPVLDGAAASIDCRIAQRWSASTHEVLVCEVVTVGLADVAQTLVYFDRGYHALTLEARP